MQNEKYLSILHIILPLVFVIEYIPIYGFYIVPNSIVAIYWFIVVIAFSLLVAYTFLRTDAKLYNHFLFATLILSLPRLQLYLHSTGLFIVLVFCINKLINKKTLSPVVFWGFIITGFLPLFMPSNVFGVYYGYLISLLNILLVIIYFASIIRNK